ncbi:F-box domain-containing protein/DUF295 domain-containing protein [Cephalotus follicularis]|uniref:F-box domain-containing protein/DUF295 domain-containing protein n=1 Tax=Cephalotus follicularis TaxID=3775 RepID=A0A1Q3BAC5_CEPFO|nr:F-box domain-containing protein/DUF295 domain-containing protein [Cephalotus follicularis]
METSSNWTNLPLDLLALIFKRLTFSDQVRFGCVCRLWFVIASQKPYPPAPELPWLLLRNNTWYLPERPHYEFFSLQENRIYKVNRLPEFRYTGKIRGFHEGWCLTQYRIANAYESFYLLNPFSKVKIRLADLFGVISDVTKAVIFSSNKYMIVAVLFADGNLAFCKVGDSEWYVPVPTQYRRFVDITFYKGKLYALRETKLDVIFVDEALLPQMVDTINIPQGQNYAKDEYLVECGNDLLVVKRYYKHIIGCTALFDVFKLQENQTTRWTKVENLSDQILLVLGRDSSLSVPAEMFPGLKESQIIFHVHDSDDLAVYSLEDGTIKPFFTPLPNPRLVNPMCVKPMCAS